jgi:outer membrane protein OmpA-like peptidoglycan-associated protein
VKRLTLYLCLAVVICAVTVVTYESYRWVKRTNDNMAALSRQVDEASQLAQKEAAAVNAASARANEAAAKAEMAANARNEAEQQKQLADQQKQQAQMSQAQAEVAAQQATQQANAARNELTALRKQREQELDHMQEALNRVVKTRRTPTGMVMVLTDATFKFDFDKADLKPKSREILSRIAGILLASKGYGLSVFGYTDDVGSAEYNKQLSVRRADAVRDYLVDAGIESSTINASGYGKTNPLVKGTTEAARAQNRRVEIALTDSEIHYSGETPGATP